MNTNTEKIKMNNKFRLKPILVTLILSTILVACSNVRPPEQNLNERLEFNEQVADSYKMDTEWWKIYQDKELDQLVQTALNNNIDLAKSAVNVNRALYQAKLVNADLVPSFSGNLNASTRSNVKNSDSAVRSFGGELGLSYEVDLWRKLADKSTMQKWEYEATLEDKEAARLALVNSVVDVYYHLAYLKEAIDVTKKNIGYYKDIQRITKLKYQTGKVDSQQFTQSSQSVLSAENNLLDLQSQQKTAEQTLRDLLNLKPSELLNPTYPDLYKQNIPGINLDIPLSVLANRPDLKAAQLRLQKAFKDVKVNEKGWYPSVSLGASLSSSSNKSDSAFNVPFTSGNVRISLPFLDWNRVRLNVKTSEADYEISRLDFEKSLTTALNEVDTYYVLYNKTQGTLDNITKKYALDMKSSKYYKVRYELGASELKDWLDALNTEYSSRLSVLNNRYQLIKYENMIYKAMAGKYTRVN